MDHFEHIGIVKTALCLTNTRIVLSGLNNVVLFG